MKRGLNILVKVSDTYELLDMFSDENITIKETNKDFDDIKKIFTSFSKSFTVPASKTNNKILGHFYRGDLIDVDPRVLIDAKLTINNVDYKYGNISLESAKFKDNNPHSYTMRFYGNLTELNKKIGEDELTDLDLNQYNISSPSFVNEVNQATLTRKAVAFPLLSRSRRFISHSGDHDYAETQGYEDVANVDYVSSTRAAGYYGMISEDLVGAIWSGSILDAIESRYGFNFTGVLKDADYVRELRLLLHNRGGDGLSGDTRITKIFDGFTPSSAHPRFSTDSNGFRLELAFEFGLKTIYASELDFTVTTTSTNFKVNLKKDGEIIETVDSAGTYNFKFFDTKYNNSDYTFEAEASGASSISISATIETYYRELSVKYDVVTQTISDSVNFSGSTGDDYVVRDNLPKMKVLDFLSELFKRFNIIATVDKDLNIDTQHFDYYINQGNTIDISKYIDREGHKISRPNFYSGVKFTTEPVQTVGEYGFQKVNGRKYGELKYDLDTGESKLDGEMYKVDLKSKIIPIDAPFDVNFGILAAWQSMLLVDKARKEIDLSPTFMYTKIMYDRRIAWDNGSTIQSLNGYMHIPSEVYYQDEDLHSTTSLGDFIIGNYFSSEVSVMLSPLLRFRDANLFNAFYKNTIAISFSDSSRRADYEAYIPMGVLTNMTTADILYVSNKPHIIESYSTNFKTGKTKLSLIQVDDSLADEFTTKTYTTPSPVKEVSYIDADTGLATFTESAGTTVNVIGGESGVYRISE